MTADPLKDFEARLPAFRAGVLARAWPNVLGGRHDVSGRAYEVRSPFDRDILLARLVAADKRTLREAVAAARAAQPTWAARGLEARRAHLARLADEIARRRMDLARAILFETGKTRRDCLAEVDLAIAALARNDGDDEQDHARQPIGTWAVIAPFSVPVSAACHMLAPCLAAGNTAVFKPAPGAGLTASLLLEAADEAGLPAGVLNLLCGEEAGALLIEQDGIDAVAVTGSQATGLKIMRRLARGAVMKPVLWDLGSVGRNPIHVTANADLDLAAPAILRAAFAFQGQSCTACGVVYVNRAVSAALLDRLKNLALSLKIGSPEDARVSLGPVINAAAVARHEAAVRTGRTRGRVITGGDRLQTGRLARGHFVAPAIITDLPLGHPLTRDEIFAPVLTVISVTDLEEGLAAETGVSRVAGIYARETSALATFKTAARASELQVNLPESSFWPLTPSARAEIQGELWNLSRFGRPVRIRAT